MFKRVSTITFSVLLGSLSQSMPLQAMYIPDHNFHDAYSSGQLEQGDAHAVDSDEIRLRDKRVVLITLLNITDANFEALSDDQKDRYTEDELVELLKNNFENWFVDIHVGALEPIIEFFRGLSRREINQIILGGVVAFCDFLPPAMLTALSSDSITPDYITMGCTIFTTILQLFRYPLQRLIKNCCKKYNVLTRLVVKGLESEKES